MTQHDVASVGLRAGSGQFVAQLYQPARWRDLERFYRAAGLFARAVALQRFADALEVTGRLPKDCEWLDRGVFDTHGPCSWDMPLPLEVRS
jgi:hypothetical protein